MLVPYRVDVPMQQRPWANILLCVSIAAFYIFLQPGLSVDSAQALILEGWGPVGMVGHMWLHGGVMHLIGNLIFLWVFGNAVCAKLGNLPYLAAYLGAGILAAACHLILDGAPAIGASGAINGVVGMYLVLYPKNEVSCFFTLGFFFRTYAVRSYWMILLWLGFDIWGAVSGGGHVAYWAHLGGFGAGLGAVGAAVYRGFLISERWESNLFEVLSIPTNEAQEGLLGAAPEESGDIDLRGIAGLAPRRPEARPEPRRRAKKSAPTENAGEDWLRITDEPRESVPERRQASKPRRSDPSTPERRRSQPQPSTKSASTGKLRWTCACGKSVTVPQRHVGRRGRCKSCGVVSRISGPEMSALPPRV